MLIITIVIIILYLLLIGCFTIGFDKVKSMPLEDIKPKIDFSIVIPFRNEAENLPDLLNSILELKYVKHKFEILFIDDDSEDESVKLIRSKLSNTKIDFTILTNDGKSNSPKKDAITKAISKSKFEWIITTDADCKLPKYWLDAFDCCIQKNDTKFIIAPVTYDQVTSFLKRFQLLDFLSLQGIGIGGFGIHKPILCNGANLAYTKTLFLELDGFNGNSHISSGDDIFLLQKIIGKNSKQIHYLKSESAIVQTAPQPNFKSLVSQRVRWAAKTSSYNSLFGKLTGLIAFLMNGFLVCSPLLVLANFISLKTLLYTFIIKFSIDFLLLFKTSRFFNQESHLTSFFFSSFIYPFFSVYIVFLSVFKGYKWKDRAYSK
ncbi:glycosyltransferase [Psychroserpens ponticola]|uniref:Glycosyltransferase n=1 Tax=Psychroserpens ponticola TaxID=2932268 RepID=A0ABY7RW49_9FLAO|nr:glycosyltransferase [Psychroserpens ponticola]WCO01345.1 glycosyltransferase [Psychroserpens ponticola]